MECFPLVLLRVAGLPKNTLLPLRWAEWGIIDQLFRQTEQQKALRLMILKEIEEVHGQLKDAFLQKRLSYLRADFQQRDRIRIDKFTELFSNHSSLIEQLKNYLQLKEDQRQSQQDFEALYAQKSLEDRKLLQALSSSPQLQNGLLFSSASLIDRIQSFQQRPAIDFRKKERQTQQTVLQYLSRIIFKTSPFNTFCGLDLKELDRVGEKQEPDSLLQLNNYLLAHLQERLEEIPAFYRSLPIQRNSSIQRTDSNYRFILNSRNAESVQVLEADELLDLIFESTVFLQSFTHLIISLQEQIESSLKELENWLIQLIKVGFLEWKWPFSILNLDADEQLLKLLQKQDDDALLKTLTSQLAQFIQYKNEFKTATFAKRQSLLQEATQLLAIMKSAMPEGEKEAPSTEHFHKFGSHPLALPREKIFYEDIRQPVTFEMSKADLHPFALSLQQLSDLIRPIQYSRINDQIRDCFNTHFPNQKTVRLLDFYQAYHQYTPPATSPNKTAIEALRQAWKEQLSQQLQLSSKGDLQLSLQQLSTLPQTSTSTTHWASSNAALLQFAQQNNQYLAYTDACITGYGKHFGRFLPLFAPRYTEQIREANRRPHPDLLHLELCDNSFFNANQHPPLFDHELTLSSARNQLPDTLQIPITEIAIHAPSNDAPLQVLHLPSQKQILPFDIGVESLESRSPMYRLLAAFSPATPAISEFKVLLNDLFGLNENDLITFPRITLDGHLLLQRKHWYIPATQVPLPQQAETESAYFLRIQQWHRQHFPSAQVFLTFQPKNISFDGQAPPSTEKGDDYKPQYFDLESPDFVRLLSKKLKGREGYVKVEERWPLGEEVKGDVISEVLVEWGD